MDVPLYDLEENVTIMGGSPNFSAPIALDWREIRNLLKRVHSFVILENFYFSVLRNDFINPNFCYQMMKKWAIHK